MDDKFSGNIIIATIICQLWQNCVPQHEQKIEINIYLNVKKLFSTKCKQYTIKERKDIGTAV